MRKAFRINTNTKCVKYENANILPEGNIEEALCKTDFTPDRTGKIFEIKRPAFKSGITKTKQSNPHFVSKRSGIGNYNIERNNFLAPPIKGREAIDFEKLQLQDIQDAGIKVQLGDKTLEQLFGIQVLDPTDTAWITEFNRRRAAGESEASINANPPFSRPQRKVKKNVNFAQQGLQMDDKLEMMKTAISSNHIENTAELTKISTNLALILGNQNNLENLSIQNFQEIVQMANRLNIPSDYRSAGFNQRLFSHREYMLDIGVINLFLISQKRGREPNFPVKNIRGDKWLKITSLGAILSDRGGLGKYLDLENRQVITLDMAKDLADTGVDNGFLNGVKPTTPDIGWVASGENPKALATAQGLPTADDRGIPVGPPGSP